MPTPTEQTATRKSRHLAHCEELAEIAMTMARATARQAAAAADRAAQAHLDDAPDEPPVKTPDHPLALARLSRVVHQSIALEVRIAADVLPGVRVPRAPPRYDPRRAPAREALGHALANHPDAARLKTDTHADLEDLLANDPDQTTPLNIIIDTICNEFGLSIDFEQLTNELLDAIAEHARPLPIEPGPDPEPPD